MAQHVDARLKEARLTSDAPAEAYSTPRRLTARVIRVAERQTDFEELVTGPPVSAAFKPDGEPTPAASGIREEIRRRGVRARAARRPPKGEYLAYRVRQRGKATVDVLADVMAGVLRDFTLPEADALGRLPRGRQGRPGVRAADSLARAPVRRARRAVRDPADGAGAGPDGAGHPIRTEHLRTSLPDDERPGRTRDQGQDVRRLPGAAARELRHPRPPRARAEDPARARNARAPAWRPGQCQPRGAVRRCCARCPTSSSIPRSSPGTSRWSSSSSPRKC